MLVISQNDILDQVKWLIEFPDSKVCKHAVALNLLSMLESKNDTFPAFVDLVKSIVNCEDDNSLKIIKDCLNGKV